MICVGIDVAKDKHDCFILNSEGVVLADVFTIPNNLEGFHTLLNKLRSCSTPQDSIKVGLEHAVSDTSITTTINNVTIFFTISFFLPFKSNVEIVSAFYMTFFYFPKHLLQLFQ